MLSLLMHWITSVNNNGLGPDYTHRPAKYHYLANPHMSCSPWTHIEYEVHSAMLPAHLRRVPHTCLSCLA